MLLPLGAQVGASLLPPLHRVQLVDVSHGFLVLAGRETDPHAGPIRHWSCRRPSGVEEQVEHSRQTPNVDVDAIHLHWWDELERGPFRRHIPIVEIKERFGLAHDVLWRFVDWAVEDCRAHLEGHSERPEMGVLAVHPKGVREDYIYRRNTRGF